ncbi:uracil-DNA glycosylase-like protein [Blastocladiella britannica]|nr:uracil-DNA glycosylase-like protein [Blastocladiella britannica]
MRTLNDWLKPKAAATTDTAAEEKAENEKEAAANGTSNDKKRSARDAGYGQLARTATAPGRTTDPMADLGRPAEGPAYMEDERVAMHPSWYNRLAPEMRQPYYRKLKEFVASERESCSVFPPADLVYTWAKNPFLEVKVVILGQDPYHGPGQAHGLSFSVLPGVRNPPSLVNIYKELQSDMGITPPSHGYLAGWARQGVLLLNATLTVRQAQANSHAKSDWGKFTDAVIKLVNDQVPHAVFILWGSFAQKKGAAIDKKKHYVIKGVHPSPLSAHRGFFGSKPFSKANAYLRSKGIDEIDWSDLPAEDPPEEEVVDEQENVVGEVVVGGSPVASSSTATEADSAIAPPSSSAPTPEEARQELEAIAHLDHKALLGDDW